MAGSPQSARPPAAVELSPAGVLAGALRGAGNATEYAFEPLRAGALTPSISETNLHAPELVASAIRSALGEVSPRKRAITLVLPDTAVRVFILDFDSLPSRAQDRYPILRFRLRRMVSFDVERAGLSFQVLKETKTECRVLASVIPEPVLAEYEGAVKAAGYDPGAVLPSSLAALEMIDQTGAALVANLSPLALTTCITSGQDLLLYRTIDLPEDDRLRLDEVRRGIAVAAAYFEDKLIARPERLHYAGIGGASEFGRWLDDPELTVVEMAPHPRAGTTAAMGRISVAGVAGALAGAK